MPTENQLLRMELNRQIEKVEELESTLEDEEASHTDTLRLWEESKAQLAAIQAELDFLHSQFQLHSPQMNGEHSWRFMTGWPWTHAKGPDIQTAIVRAMAEVERSKQEAKESDHA